MEHIIVYNGTRFSPLTPNHHIHFPDGSHLLILDPHHPDSWWMLEFAFTGQAIYVCSWNDAFTIEVQPCDLDLVLLLLVPVSAKHQ